VKPSVNRALLVGGFTAVMGLASLATITFVKQGGYGSRDSYVVHAFFSDATGLTWKSRVQIAGIQIGEVSEIRLVGPKARLDLRIRKDVELHADGCLHRTFPSALLADAVLEVALGTPATPRLADLPEEQREVKCVTSAATVQEVMDVMNQVAKDVQTITGDLAKTVAGSQGSMSEIVENLARVTRQIDEVISTNGQTLSDILSNTRDFTGDLSELSGEEKQRFHNIARNVEDLTFRLREVVASVQEIVGLPRAGTPAPGGGAAAPGAGAPPGQAQAEERARGIREAVDRLSASATKLDELVSKVSEGKSIAGKLLVDERMGRQLGEAVEGVSEYVTRLQKLQIQLQLRSEFLLNQSFEEGRPGSKIYFGARLLPRPDKYYLLELVSDPRGVTTVTTETISTRPPGSSSENTTIVTKSLNEEKLTISLQLAKRYGPFTFRVGVIEGSGGVGSDLHLLDDALQVSVSFYQFSRPYQNVFPRAKAWLNWYFLQNFYLTTGVDDFLNRWRSGSFPGARSFNIGTDVFFGGGFFFTDDDLKTLFGSGAGTAIPASK
jgi:phospholipid/cholesterol/gamma-HCH transport system substrate-binding protein